MCFISIWLNGYGSGCNIERLFIPHAAAGVAVIDRWFLNNAVCTDAHERKGEARGGIIGSRGPDIAELAKPEKTAVRTSTDAVANRTEPAHIRCSRVRAVPKGGCLHRASRWIEQIAIEYSRNHVTPRRCMVPRRAKSPAVIGRIIVVELPVEGIVRRLVVVECVCPHKCICPCGIAESRGYGVAVPVPRGPHVLLRPEVPRFSDVDDGVHIAVNVGDGEFNRFHGQFLAIDRPDCIGRIGTEIVLGVRGEAGDYAAWCGAVCKGRVMGRAEAKAACGYSRTAVGKHDCSQ